MQNFKRIPPGSVRRARAPHMLAEIIGSATAIGDAAELALPKLTRFVGPYHAMLHDPLLRITS